MAEVGSTSAYPGNDSANKTSNLLQYPSANLALSISSFPPKADRHGGLSP
jgi:hypothetical protein